MNNNNQNLANNLRYLCDFEKSVSEVCRVIGINRQQFAIYLKGVSQPSPYNMKRICQYFDTKPADLQLSHEEFENMMSLRKVNTSRFSKQDSNLFLRQVFQGDLQKIRRYLGYYHTHFYSSVRAGAIIRAITHLYEQDGVVLSKSVERIKNPEDGVTFLSKYDGQAALLGNRLFIIERQSLANDAIVETVLYSQARSNVSLLHGVTLGIDSTTRDPYVSRCVYKFLGTHIDLRDAFEKTGLFEVNSTNIEPRIKRLLGEPPEYSEQNLR